MRINIYAHLIIIEILDEIYARAQTWSSVEYSSRVALLVEFLDLKNYFAGFQRS